MVLSGTLGVPQYTIWGTTTETKRPCLLPDPHAEDAVAGFSCGGICGTKNEADKTGHYRLCHAIERPTGHHMRHARSKRD